MGAEVSSVGMPGLGGLAAPGGGGSGPAQGGNADTADLAQRVNVKPWDLAANSTAGAAATFVEAGAGGTVGGVTLSAADAEGWQTLSGADLAAPFMWATTGAAAVSGRHAWAVKVPDNITHPALYPTLALYVIDGAASAAAVMAAAANQGQSPGTDVTAVMAFPQAMTFPATMAAQALDMPLGATQASPLAGAPAQPVSFPAVALGDVFRVGVDVATGEVFIGYQDGAEISLGTSSLLAGKTSLQIISVHQFLSTPRTGSVYLDASAPLGATAGFGGGATIVLPTGTQPGTFLDVIGTGSYRHIPLKNEDAVLVLNAGGDIINLGRQDLSLYVTQQQLATLAATVKPKSVLSGNVPPGSVELLTSGSLVKWAYAGAGIQLFDRGGYVEIVSSAPDGALVAGSGITLTDVGGAIRIDSAAAADGGDLIGETVSAGLSLFSKAGRDVTLRKLVAATGATLTDDVENGVIRIGGSAEATAIMQGFRASDGAQTTSGLFAGKVGIFFPSYNGPQTLQIDAPATESTALGKNIPVGAAFFLVGMGFTKLSLVAEQGAYITGHGNVLSLRQNEFGLLYKNQANGWTFLNVSRLSRFVQTRTISNWNQADWPTLGDWLTAEDAGGRIVFEVYNAAQTLQVPTISHFDYPVYSEVRLLNQGSYNITLQGSGWAEKSNNLTLVPGEEVAVLRTGGSSWLVRH